MTSDLRTGIDYSGTWVAESIMGGHRVLAATDDSPLKAGFETMGTSAVRQ
mgnify:CR=1 FL=1